jgi:hypothetical protein
VIAYAIFVITSILAGIAAVALYRRKDTLDPKIFLAGALVYAGALLAILFYRGRRNE